MPRRAAKVDANQPSMFTELRSAGFHVMPMHTLGEGRPDALVTGYSLRLDCVAALLVEIKTENGTLTGPEKKFFREYPEGGPLIIARSADDILQWFGR